MLLIPLVALSATQGELVTNGLLSQRHGGQPVGWQHAAYFSDPASVKFSWDVDTAGIGFLRILNTKLNDSRWAQVIPVSPSTWYRVSGWARAENAVPAIGARLVVGESGSADLRGTSDWRLLQFWMKTRPDQSSAYLECRLGGASALSTGAAYFTAISVYEEPPPSWVPDEQIFGGSPRDHPGQRWLVIASLLILILTAALIPLLRRFVVAPPAGSPSEPDTLAGHNLRRFVRSYWAKLRAAARAISDYGPDDESTRTEPHQTSGATLLWLARSRTTEALFVAACAGAFAVAFSYPLLGHVHAAWSIYDWPRLFDLDWTAVYIVTKFRQFPLWSPYQCGGLPLLANPESRILTPFFLLHLLFGSAMGFNLEVPIRIAIAWAGGYVLGRVLGMGPLGAVACASAFPTSSWLYAHYGAGHPHLLAHVYSPWMVTGFLLALQCKRLAWAAAVGGLMALSFFEGGYPVMDTGLAIALLSIVLAVRDRSVWPVVVCLSILLFTVGFAAPKLFALLSTGQTRATPWAATEEWVSLSEYGTVLFSRNQSLERWLVWSGTGSMPLAIIGVYLSPFFLGLALIGVCRSSRRAMPWLLLMGALVVLGMGNYFGPWSPWVLLHHLPGFSWLRVAIRYFILLPLFLGVLAGFALDGLSLQPSGATLGAVLLVGGIVDGYLVGVPNLVGPEWRLAPPTYSYFHQVQVKENYPETVLMSMANIGVTNCSAQMATIGNVAASNMPGYRGEQYLLEPGSLTLVHWTPDILDYDVDVQSHTVMVVNQNYDRYWKLARGKGEVFSYNRLLAVRLPAGKQRLELRYRSYPFLLGLSISIMTMFVAFWV